MATSAQLEEILIGQLAELKPGTTLPTDRELGKLHGLGERSVRRVMGKLRDRGLVERVPGRGTTKPRDNDKTPALPVGRPTAPEALAEVITESILAGDLRTGDPLPQTKFLCLQYKVSRTTVTSAFGLLEQAGHVRKVGRRYWVGGFSPVMERPQTNEAFLVFDTEEIMRLAFSLPNVQTLYGRIEKELRNCGVSPVCITHPQLAEAQRQWQKTKRFPVGLLFGIAGADKAKGLTRIAEQFCTPSQGMINVCVDLISSPKATKVPRSLKVFSRGNISTSRSRSAAEFLVNKVRKDIVLVVDTEVSNTELRTSLLSFQKEVAEILLLGKGAVSVQQVTISSSPKVTRKSILQRMNSVAPEYARYLNTKYASIKQNSPMESLLNITVLPDMKSVLKNFGKKKCWLLASDRFAEEAVKTCKEARVRIPHDISIMSLRNTSVCAFLGITACTPDWDLLGYLMAHAVIGDFSFKRTHRGFVRQHTPVVVRSST